MTHTNFQIFLEISLPVMVEVVDLALRAVIDSFEIYTINSMIKNKIRNWFDSVQSFIWGRTTSSGLCKCCFQ